LNVDRTSAGVVDRDRSVVDKVRERVAAASLRVGRRRLCRRQVVLRVSTGAFVAGIGTVVFVVRGRGAVVVVEDAADHCFLRALEAVHLDGIAVGDDHGRAAEDHAREHFFVGNLAACCMCRRRRGCCWRVGGVFLRVENVGAGAVGRFDKDEESDG